MIKHIVDATLTEIVDWLVKHEFTEFTTKQRFGALVKQGVLNYSHKINNKKVYNSKQVVDDLKKGGLFRGKEGVSIQDMPMPKDGQSQDEYQKTVVSLGLEPSLNEANIFYTIYRGKLAQQKFDIEAEKLVYKEDIENKAFSAARVIRDQLLTMPEKMSAELSTMTDAVEIRELLYEEIIKSLAVIAKGTPFAG